MESTNRIKLPCIASPQISRGVEGVGTRTRNLGHDEEMNEPNKNDMCHYNELETPSTWTESGSEEIRENDTVLFIGGMPHPREYDYFVNSFQGRGIIKRIRQSKNNDKTLLVQNKETWNCIIWFDNTISLKEAIQNKGKLDECKPITISTFQERNVQTSKRDYIPESYCKQQKTPKLVQRKPKWFVGRFEGGRKQSYKVYKHLREKIGPIDEVKIKQFGRGVLIKVEDDLQREILLQMAAQRNENETPFSVTPHRSFNSTKGVIHDNEFRDMDEQEIWQLCPDEVMNISKLGKEGNLIVAEFNTEILPSQIKIGYINKKVKKYKEKPLQCKKCHKFGHSKYCRTENETCIKCGGEHLLPECKDRAKCIHCQGNHWANDRNCKTYFEEQEILETAFDHKVDYFEARKIWRENNLLVPYTKALTNNLANKIQNNQKEPLSKPTRNLSSNDIGRSEPRMEHTNEMDGRNKQSTQEISTTRSQSNVKPPIDKEYNKTKLTRKDKTHNLNPEHLQRTNEPNAIEIMLTDN